MHKDLEAWLSQTCLNGHRPGRHLECPSSSHNWCVSRVKKWIALPRLSTYRHAAGGCSVRRRLLVGVLSCAGLPLVVNGRRACELRPPRLRTSHAVTCVRCWRFSRILFSFASNPDLSQWHSLHASRLPTLSRLRSLKETLASTKQTRSFQARRNNSNDMFFWEVSDLRTLRRPWWFCHSGGVYTPEVRSCHRRYELGVLLAWVLGDTTVSQVVWLQHRRLLDRLRH